MPRMNIEDSFWSDRRFLRLCALMGDEMMAVGAIVIAWKEAQKHWIPEQKPIPKQCWQDMPQAEALIKSGWAKETEDGFYIFGTQKAFAWWFDKQEAGQLGGRISAKRPRDAMGRLKPNQNQAEPSTVQAETKQNQTSSSCSRSSSDREPHIHIVPLVEDPEPVQGKDPTGSTQCVEIVEYLNRCANTEFRANAKAHAKHINARLKDGYTVEQFKAVIDTKVRDWPVGDPYRKYLRPETLFNETKFESYLNESKMEKPIDHEQEFADFMRESTRPRDAV